ncbi:hypothetical protein TNIN_366421 [Trichonephila inaurata madagascariensis]|uniref:Mutator-like transposase domain-containing protein n=1 Tax=Trichonephila inaurata madagascariensis TaxID=2747483 RepID=A0A8X6X9X9_9ARAC|nr:hypothetical protein TNIN_366421 [Trichonephila inaurata madagascariensis]
MLIGADCGKVLDMEVLSSYCKRGDSYKGSKFGSKYSAFFAKRQTFCRKNWRVCWRNRSLRMQNFFFRSEQEHGLKYQQYLDDGDSKRFSFIAEKNHMGMVFRLKK